MVTLDGLRDQAKRVVAPIMLAAAVTTGSAGKVDAQQAQKPTNDNFVAAKEIAKPVSTSTNAQPKTFESIIEKATLAGFLKSQDDFKTLNGSIDKKAYNDYVQSIITKSEVFTDEGGPQYGLSKLLGTLKRIQEAGGITKEQKDLILLSSDYAKAREMAGLIYGDLLLDGLPLERVREKFPSYAEQYLSVKVFAQDSLTANK